MGFYKKDLVSLEPVTRLLALKNELGLNFLPDDLFLGLQLLRKGKIRFAKKAVSKSSSRDWKLKDWVMRGISQKYDYLALKKYVTTKTN